MEGEARQWKAVEGAVEALLHDLMDVVGGGAVEEPTLHVARRGAETLAQQHSLLSSS